MNKSEAQNLLEFKKIKNSDGSETVHYAAFGSGMPKESQTFAEKELGETPEKVSRGIKSLRKFSEDRGLPRIDDVYLVAVLRNCKYDLKKSKVKLEKFWRAKELVAERVAELELDKVNAIFDDKSFVLLPYRDKHKRLILMSQATVNLEVYSMNDVFTLFLATVLYLLTYPTTSLYGIAYIGIAKTPSVPLMYHILMAYKTWFKTLFDLPLSIRKIDVTHENFLIRWFLNFARHLVPAKVYKRISVHGDNLETLKKAYHPDMLPEELEGNLGPVNTEHFRKKVIDFMRSLKDEYRAKNIIQ